MWVNYLQVIHRALRKALCVDNFFNVTEFGEIGQTGKYD